MTSLNDWGTLRKLSLIHISGTAKIAAGKRGYKVEPKYRASFVGYFPADKPLYTCIVVVDNPSTSVGYYGNVVSGNVFREIADKVYSCLLYTSRVMQNVY